MSGRRRRDDGWNDGHLEAQDDWRDPWADDRTGDWGGYDANLAGEAGRPGKSAGGTAGSHVRSAPPGAAAHEVPNFPSFQAAGASPDANRYGSDSGYDGQRGSQNGHASGEYSGGRYREARYGGSRDGYQEIGYERTASNGNGAGRRDDAGYGAGYGSAGYGSGSAGYAEAGNADAGYGSAGYAGASGRSGYAPAFTAVDSGETEDEGAVGTPRPYGRLSIFTLHGDKVGEFDRLAERAAEGVRMAEPDTLVYVIHVVPKAPQQRIIYEIYRDRAAFQSHERQPHIRQFAVDRVSCVLATNIIDLRLKYAKVAAVSSPSEAAPQTQSQSQTQAQPQSQAQSQSQPQPQPQSQSQPQSQPQAGWSPSAPQYSSAPQYTSAQYTPPESQGPGLAAAASFTPAVDHYGGDNNHYGGDNNSQYAAAGRDAYSPAPQYGISGNGAYGAGNGQYDAANSNGYPGAAGYANGGSYSSNGYLGGNGYQSANGYPGDNGYSGASGYQNGNGYSGANDYPNGNGYQSGNGYQNGNGYANGANGYSAGVGYSNGSGYSNGYGAVSGYQGNAGSYSAPASTQYTPRYRELTSGSDDAATGYAGNEGGGSQDDGRQPARPSERDPRSQGYQ